MDAVSIITAIIVIGIFMLIFILPSMGVKKTQKEMHAKLQTLADKHQAKVSKSAILGDSIIGLDEEKKSVFFYRQVKDVAISNVIQLSEIRNCKMLNQSKSNKSKNENFNQFERLGLQFIAIDNNKPDIILEFYNIEDSSYLNFDLKVLEQWNTKLNQQLK
jgi:hypothetical protein